MITYQQKVTIIQNEHFPYLSLWTPSFTSNFQANKKHHKPCTYKQGKNVTFNV